MCFKKLFRKKEKIAAADAPVEEAAPAETAPEPGKIELEPEAEIETENE